MKRMIAIFSVAFFCVSCIQMEVLYHDENMAAQVAEKFATSAFVDNDFQASHSLLPKKHQEELPLEKLVKLIEELHPNGYPAEIKATEFEPMPGQSAMQIFLEGANKKETFYYQFIMEGGKQEGYTIKGMYRGETRYPPSTLRKRLGRK